MTHLRNPRARGEAGFTLVETLTALLVFSIITIGVVPLLGNSMKSLAVSRNRAVAENVVRAATERLEGIRYYVSWDAKAKKVDLLDYYLPQTAGTFAPGQSYSTAAANPPLTSPTSGGTGVFTTVCPPPSGTNQACPPNIPAGYTLTFTASFVEPVTTTTPQTYRVVNPGASYSASPGVAGTCPTTPCSDKPPADLIDLKVTGSWSYGAKARSFTARNLIGERTFSATNATDASPPPPGATPAPSSAPVSTAVQMRGNATIDYVVRAETGWSLTSGTNPQPCATEPCNHSEMNLVVGTSESQVETKDTSQADVATRYAEARVVRTYPAGTTPPASPPPDLNYVTGATSILHAPPYDYRTLDDQKTAILDVSNPDQPLSLQGRIYQHENHDLKVDVGNELPQAEGNFRGAAGTTGALDWYVNNTHRDPSLTGPMHLDTGYPIFWGIKYATAAGSALAGSTKVNTGALGAVDRRVQSVASFRMPWMYIVGRVYAGKNGADSFHLGSFYDLVANVNCKATGNPATASATGSWSVSFQYYYDPNNNGSSRDVTGGFLTINSNGPDMLNNVSVPDALAALKAQNPLIYDGSLVNGCCGSTSDMYLFDVRTGNTSTSTRGYLSDWSANKNVETKLSSDGRQASASINGAIRIETASLRQTLTPDVPDSAVSVSLGKLSCNAEDNR